MASKKHNNIPKVLSKNSVAFAALAPYVESNIVSAKEEEIRGKDFISWGDSNSFPNYLYDLYSNCSTLQSIINGTTDFVVGNDAICNVVGFENKMNKKGETLEDILGRIATDYLIYGAFALQVLRDIQGRISEIYWVDVNKLRSDKKNEIFFYSEDWSKSYGRVQYLKYPKFKPTDINNASSIFYYKNPQSRNVYGVPTWNAAILACETEKRITEFHFNEICNGFTSSKLISFNAGLPDDNLKEEIERNINEKFGGSSNAGRIMISFSENKDSAPTVENLDSDSFDERYTQLAKNTKETIFTAFRAIPQIFGLMSESTGFNSQEFNESFKLYNRTTIKPIQKAFSRSFDYIFGVDGAITIVPFSLEESVEEIVE